MQIDFTPRTVYVSGTYGSGKSTRVCEYLASVVGGDHNLLAVCYRQSQGLDLAGKFESSQIPFTLYLGKRNDVIQQNKRRLLISTQSIAKICPVITYDTVVIDETTSLLLDSGVSKLVPRQNLDILLHVMQTARKLILMDVNLPPSTTALVAELRGEKAMLPAHIQYIPKLYTNRIIMESSAEVWRAAIMESLIMGHNIVICSDSKKELLDLCMQLPDSVRKRVYTNGHPYADELSNVNEVWPNFQVVAYSPSIVTATSFIVDHFHTVYGLFTYSSLSAREFAQQLHRVRNIGSGEIVVHAAQPKTAYLRNQSPLVQQFDPYTGTIAECDTIDNRLRKLYNQEIQRTYEDFKQQLFSAISPVLPIGSF